jgi:hypothetical protein
MVGSLDRIPDGIEPIVGYRAWLYGISGPRAKLHPLGTSGTEVTTASPWDGAESGWVVASCARGCDPTRVPGELCTCGFYSVKTLLILLQMFGSFTDPAFEFEPGSGCVFGRVELAGKIIEHDDGYRAERARVAELIPFEGDITNGIRLASLLGLGLGTPIASNMQLPPPPPPPPRLFPPNGPSSLRLRVREWVLDLAA